MDHLYQQVQPGMEQQTPQVDNTVRPQMPQHADLIASPVRRIMYPSMYGGFQQPQLFTELQKDAAIANELERLTRQIVFLQDDNQRLHHDNTTLVDTLDERDQSLKESEISLRNRDQRILGLDACKRNMEADITGLNESITMAHAKNAELVSTVEDKCAVLQRNKLEQDSLMQQLRDKDQENTNLRTHDLNTTGYACKLEGDVKQRDSEIQDREARCQELRLKVDDRTKQLSEVNLTNKTLSEMVQARNNEIVKLQSDLEFYVQTCDQLKAEKQDLRNQLGESRAENSNLNKSLNSLKVEFDQKCAECVEHKHQISTLEQAKSAQAQEILGLKADKVGLETTLQTKNATIDDLGINLNNSNLDRQRFAMVASERTAQVNQMANNVANTNLLYGSRQLNGLNGLNNVNPYLGNSLLASTLPYVNPLLAPPSPSTYLARSLIGKSVL